MLDLKGSLNSSNMIASDRPLVNRLTCPLGCINTVFIFTAWHLATSFLVFFSFLDSTLSGHVTQTSDFLRYRKMKVTDNSEAAKFWKVVINFHEVMIIIRFYAN